MNNRRPVKLKPFGPIYTIWDQINTIYGMYEAEGMESGDLGHEVDLAIAKIKEMTDAKVLQEAAEALRTEVIILQIHIELKIGDIADYRRILACRELSLVSPNCPISISYRVIGKRYGFSPETVRKFYTRYPHYFKCKAISEF